MASVDAANLGHFGEHLSIARKNIRIDLHLKWHQSGGCGRSIAECKKPIDAIRRLSSAAMTAKKADRYSPETYVIDLAELWQIIWEMQEDAASSIQK